MSLCRLALLAIAAAEFYEPCTPAQALQALRAVGSLDAGSGDFNSFCQGSPTSPSRRQNFTGCGCFAGLLAVKEEVVYELAKLKVLRQVDAKKLQNRSAALQLYRIKLRRGPGLAEARAALREKFKQVQHSLSYTAGMALRFADERNLGFQGDRFAALMSEFLVYFKLEYTEPAYGMMVQNHNTCLLDIFAGRCEKRNLPIFEKFPAVQGPPQEGFMLDFLGVSVPIEADCQERQFALLAPGRTMLCEYYKSGMPLPRVWPVLDEEYLEWADILTTAMDAAKAGRPFRMAEFGSGPYGIWAMRAAKAFTAVAAADQPCELLLVEPFELGDGSILQTHTAMNLPLGRCEFLVHEDLLSTNDQVKALLGSGDLWDLVDIDIQGAEHEILPGLFAWLSTRVRRLHVSTHTRQIHWQLVEELERDGWQIQAQYPTFSMVGLENNALGSFLTCDGHISDCTPADIRPETCIEEKGRLAVARMGGQPNWKIGCQLLRLWCWFWPSPPAERCVPCPSIDHPTGTKRLGTVDYGLEMLGVVAPAIDSMVHQKRKYRTDFEPLMRKQSTQGVWPLYNRGYFTGKQIAMRLLLHERLEMMAQILSLSMAVIASHVRRHMVCFMDSTAAEHALRKGYAKGEAFTKTLACLWSWVAETGLQLSTE
ncbi:unnamed protein product [Symbiodinium necroappetens]|uniref:Methyltransferase FkbM domain-containing protein n=1 Tax=Symbiodinium necroappetens TaxID=1628268 RepID=A0A812ZN32_9DINO|nr:unnamed protein product [Symbiodinium necroappetens]